MHEDQRALAHLSAVHGAAESSYNLGQLLVDRGRPHEAIVYFQRAVELDPTMQPAHAAIAQLHGAAGDADAIRRRTRGAATRSPPDLRPAARAATTGRRADIPGNRSRPGVRHIELRAADRLLSVEPLADECRTDSARVSNGHRAALSAAGPTDRARARWSANGRRSAAARRLAVAAIRGDRPSVRPRYFDGSAGCADTQFGSGGATGVGSSS